MINILYIHGYNSSSTSQSLKIEQLEKEFNNVYRIAPDYDLGYDSVVREVLEFAKDLEIDALIGTSMGGYLAADISQKLVVPYVSINPCIYPSLSLVKYGLSGDELHSYPDFSPSDLSGLVLLGMKDVVIDPFETMIFLDNRLPLLIDDDACHQFPDLVNYIDEIAIFLYSASAHGPKIL